MTTLTAVQAAPSVFHSPNRSAQRRGSAGGPGRTVVQRCAGHCRAEQDDAVAIPVRTSRDERMPAPGADGLSLVREALSSPGTPLHPADRRFMERRFGHDFSTVRVHTDDPASQSARSISALAYTAGDHIAFLAGQYSPQTESGRRLLAHELAHVVQQRASAPQGGSPGGLRLGDPGDSLERGAVSAADRVMTVHAGVTDTAASPAGIIPSAGSAPGAAVQRKLRIGADLLDARRVNALISRLVSGPLRGLVTRAGLRLVTETIHELQSDPDVLTFPDLDALASNVRERVLVSYYMRVSQGSTRLLKAFSYPDREGDKTKGIPAKVNDDAKQFWGPVQNWPGTYYFDLSPTGKANAYAAVTRLFKEWTEPRKRTLIHCDYLVSLVEFRAYAENLGTQRFNALVASGALPLRLKWNGFTDLLRLPGPLRAARQQPWDASHPYRKSP